jgi:CRP-like cAMP-binding protein
MQTLLHYTSAYIGQIVQTAACNRHGSVEQRLCRWLLLNLDRVSSSELTMTHETIADALGVKREGITEAAGRLRRLGAIRYQRGHIDVLDRAILESRTGEFYRPGPRKTERGVVGVH